MNGTNNESGPDIEAYFQKLLTELSFVKADIAALSEKQEADNKETARLMAALREEYRTTIVQLRVDLTRGLSRLSSMVTDNKKKQIVRRMASSD